MSNVCRGTYTRYVNNEDELTTSPCGCGRVTAYELNHRTIPRLGTFEGTFCQSCVDRIEGRVTRRQVFARPSAAYSGKRQR